MRKLFLFLIHSTFLTALAGVAIYSGTAIVHGKFNPFMAAFIGSSTWGLYLLHRLYKIQMGAVTEARLRYWLITNYRLLFSLLIALLLCSAVLLYFIQLSFFQYAYLILFSVIGCWYVIPIGGRSLRTIPFIKSLVVAVTWSLHLLYFPVFFDDPIKSYWLELVSWILFFYAITVPFDSRDSEKDEAKMNTFPQLIGKKLAGASAAVILVVFGILSSIIYPNIPYNFFFWMILLLFIIMINRFVRSQRQEAYFIFDLLMILLGCSFFIN